MTTIHRYVIRLILPVITAALLLPASQARQSVKRHLVQDSTLNNLIDPPGYTTARPGTLGRIEKRGTGTRALILIPGFGFGGQVFDTLITALEDRYVIYAVTLAGFGGTQAPPSPDASTSFGAQTWTLGAVTAIERLIDEEQLPKPILVGHWVGGTQIALKVALRHPDRIAGVILLAGSARMVASDSARAAMLSTPEKRAAVIDKFMAPRWFKTVTRETWDDNNFLPGDYAVNPVIGLRLWRQAASPALHVWVRYLCEFNAQDITAELQHLKVPTLLVKPGLEGNYYDPSNNYMDAFCNTSWNGVVERHPAMQVVTIPHTRVCLWYDAPEAIIEQITTFLRRIE